MVASIANWLHSFICFIFMIISTCFSFMFGYVGSLEISKTGCGVSKDLLHGQKNTPGRPENHSGVLLFCVSLFLPDRKSVV